jgi:hypothetical protein
VQGSACLLSLGTQAQTLQQEQKVDGTGFVKIVTKGVAGSKGAGKQSQCTQFNQLVSLAVAHFD